jgi:hypothetical protein
LIIDSNPSTYQSHPQNAIPIEAWFGDPDDLELLNLIPILEQLAKVKSVTEVIDRIMKKMKDSFGIDPEILEAKQRNYLHSLDPEDVELYNRFLGNKVTEADENGSD